LLKGFTTDGTLRFSILEIQDTVQTAVNNFSQQKDEISTSDHKTNLAQQFERHNLSNLFTANFLMSSLLYGEERCKLEMFYTGKISENP
jgi:nicotinamide mononucleotide adenylyltransferase